MHFFVPCAAMVGSKLAVVALFAILGVCAAQDDAVALSSVVNPLNVGALSPQPHLLQTNLEAFSTYRFAFRKLIALTQGCHRLRD